MIVGEKPVLLPEKWEIPAQDLYFKDGLPEREGRSPDTHFIRFLQTSGIRSAFLEKGIPADRNSFLQSEWVKSYHELVFDEFLQYRQNRERYGCLLCWEEAYRELKNLFSACLSRDWVESMLSALKVWDFISYLHSLDVFIFGNLWLLYLGISPGDEVGTGFLLHDIGKLKVPRHILQKKDGWTESERNIYRLQPLFGYEILDKLDFPVKVKNMALYHHSLPSEFGRPAAGRFFPWYLHVLAAVDRFSVLTMPEPFRLSESEDILTGFLMQETKNENEDSFQTLFSSCGLSGENLLSTAGSGRFLFQFLQK